MIIIKYLYYYGKTLIIFILLQIFIAFILSFFELFGFDTGLLHLLSLISNIIIDGIISFKYGKNTNKKAWQEGLIIGILLNIILFIINLLFFRTISILSIFYYSILLIISISFSIIGKNKKGSTVNEK